ncbi:DUF4333 domain-containing protein [Pseudolysinimonas yzui]|uniref:DUF4333 domain-containing protein n=1 Tax=Pseudolysinimonas yzui TaxID=2708254 RepID=A0A8J3GNG2_9MICO|nr:DUF4333 domain-containing protein [Pseudolysinimonas yzui]GHF06945.1 hypothetical protein GCM10011600_04480 [Pseudolysinimonas yzui]
MRSRSLTLAPVAALAITLLAGCTFSVGVNTAPTVPPEDIETLAADKLEEQVGVRPTIDCGEEEIPVEVDTSITCLLVDPVVGLEFDTVITFTEVDGTNYAFDIQVADVPNNAPEPTAEPGASVPIADIEALAITALNNVLDYVPEVTCEGTEVAIVVGNTVDCSYESPDGPVDAVVTITAFDATTGTYEIRVD